jgi:hypothetical protein
MRKKLQASSDVNAPRKIKWGLIYLLLAVPIITNPWSQVSIFELPKITTLYAVTIALIALYARDICKSFKKHKIARRLTLLWVASLLITTFFSFDPELSLWGFEGRWQGLFAHLCYVAIFWIFLSTFKKTSKGVTRKQTIDRVFHFIIAIASIISLYAIIQKLGIDFFPQEHLQKHGFYGRSFATLGQPNMLGQFLLFTIWITISKLPKQQRGPIIVSLVLQASALLLTQNRASIIALAITILIYLFQQKKILRHYLAIILGAVLITIFFLKVAPTTRSLQSRIIIWQTAFEFLSNVDILPLLFGHGLETIQETLHPLLSDKIANLEGSGLILDRSHNYYLDLLLTQGLFGLGVYLTIIGSTLKIAWRKISQSKSMINIRRSGESQEAVLVTLFLSLALISTLITNLFSFPLTSHQIYLALVVALVVGHGEKSPA